MLLGRRLDMDYNKVKMQLLRMRLIKKYKIVHNEYKKKLITLSQYTIEVIGI